MSYGFDVEIFSDRKSYQQVKISQHLIIVVTEIEYCAKQLIVYTIGRRP